MNQQNLGVNGVVIYTRVVTNKANVSFLIQPMRMGNDRFIILFGGRYLLLRGWLVQQHGYDYLVVILVQVPMLQ